jgi:hypothetical protein
MFVLIQKEQKWLSFIFLLAFAMAVTCNFNLFLIKHNEHFRSKFAI